MDGLYRRCGVATRTNQLVEALSTSPDTAALETDEQGVLDVCSALKQLLRRQTDLIPQDKKDQWVQAAGNTRKSF